MTIEEINKKYPCVPIVHTKFTPIVDDNSGIIAADVYINSLKKALLKFKNVTIKEKCSISEVNDSSSNLK